MLSRESEGRGATLPSREEELLLDPLRQAWVKRDGEPFAGREAGYAVRKRLAESLKASEELCDGSRTTRACVMSQLQASERARPISESVRRPYCPDSRIQFCQFQPLPSA